MRIEGSYHGLITRALKGEKEALLSRREREVFVEVVLECVLRSGSFWKSEYQFRLGGDDVEEIISRFDAKVGEAVMDMTKRVRGALEESNGMVVRAVGSEKERLGALGLRT